MKTNMIAAAVLALVASAASAQSSVQLMGTTDIYAGGIRMAGDAGRRTVVNSGGMTTSWVGVKGTEDLGGGLKANFALTTFIQVDTGNQGRFANDPYFSRDANVSRPAHAKYRSSSGSISYRSSASDSGRSVGSACSSGGSSAPHVRA